MRQTPIVKLHSSPGTDSDSDNEIDDRFDKKYEELLTFETNEDERREQRLLKALSDIAAKAKQKIQSIADSNIAKNLHQDRNHNTQATTKIVKSTKDNMKKSNDAHDERHSDKQSSEDRYENDYSPKDRRYSSHRSRRESSSSTSKDDESTYVCCIQI